MITASGWQPMYARRADHMKAWEIRELLKLLERPGIVSSAGGKILSGPLPDNWSGDDEPAPLKSPFDFARGQRDKH
jgi:hypothetical protein